MGNAYRVGKYKLTAMQNATYNYIKGLKKPQDITQIVSGLYAKQISGELPDLWNKEDKINNVKKWTKTLVHLKIIETNGSNFYCG